MSDTKPKVLVVDDEQFNLDLIEEYLSEINVDVLCVDRGEKALSVLKESPQLFSAVLLDRMMPGIDGIEVLVKIKEDEVISRLPVIMQTAKTGRESMLEGLNAGAHYYLSKPYDQPTLVAIVSTAIRDYEHYVRMQNSLKQSVQTLEIMDRGTFSFKSIEQGRRLASLLANTCPNSEKVVLGLTELITNAVEHGNLGITYEEKSKLNAEGRWESEILSRLSSPTYKDKIAIVEFERNSSEITFTITDQGKGFDWYQYMEISPERAFDSHGRGIALAKSISFDQIKYHDDGKKVCITVPRSE
ncbi:hypothetical protein MNBD_GAMMA05-655 [hydrothermal vent metagenome]|uniref:Response regulatory domain-containing protein n=1 Tax=hydrothermal vent metagenome TaxID=652676 RepID=A0A3B0WIJ1_9ZZZZ